MCRKRYVLLEDLKGRRCEFTGVIEKALSLEVVHVAELHLTDRRPLCTVYIDEAFVPPSLRDKNDSLHWDKQGYFPVKLGKVAGRFAKGTPVRFKGTITRVSRYTLPLLHIGNSGLYFDHVRRIIGKRTEDLAEGTVKAGRYIKIK